jgi:hypothetical protein
MTGLNLVPGSMPPSCGMNAHAATKYAKVCNVIGKSLHGQLPPCWEAVNAQKPRLAHRFLRVSGLAPRWQKGQTLVNGREVV